MGCNHGISKLPQAPKNASYASEVETTSHSNRKRKQSPMGGQSAPINKQIHIQKSPIDLDKDEDHRIYWISDDAQAEDSDCVEIKPPPQTERSRSLSTIPDRLQGLVRQVQIEVTNHTLFTMPFLSPVEVLFLLADAWERAQDRERRYEAKTKAVDAYVSISCLNLNLSWKLTCIAQIHTLQNTITSGCRMSG